MSDVDQTLVTELVERVRNRYYGKYRGTVTRVDDATLRIKAKIPAVLGTTESGWCMACVPYAGPDVGIAFLPEQGAGVWIEFEGGDVSYPIWVGCYWREGETPAAATGTVKAIATAEGKMTILFDTDAGSITVKDPSENEVTLDSSGITLKRGSSTVVISDSSVNLNDGAIEALA